MWFLTVLLFASCTFYQSFPGSVLVYTSDSSTYFVTDAGTTTLEASLTICPNISQTVLTSTVFEPTLTITVNQQTSSAQQPTSTNTVVTNNGFENGTSIPFNSSASTSSVSADVVQSGPYQPRTGDSYLYAS